MSALSDLQNRRYTIEEFRELDFGEQHVELINGLIVLDHAFPSDQHALITENLGYHLRLALDASGNHQCRPMSTSGVTIRGRDHGLPNDNDLGPDLAVRCRNKDGTWTPSLIVEVLSKSNSADEMADKLRAYKTVPSIEDVIYLNQNKHYAVHHRRRGGVWQAGIDLSGPDAEIVIERWSARIRLQDAYEQVF